MDVGGKPVKGARVSTFAGFSARSKDFAPDESGWSYYPKVVSDGDGMARITDKYGIDCVIARHVGKKLVAIQSVSPEQAKGTVTVTMHPECKVFGRLTSKKLEARNRKLTWTNVYLYLNDKRGRPMSCQSDKSEFHFFVSPGTYKLDAYSMDTHAVWKTIAVKPGQQELKIEPIDMPPTRLALLEGQPAPELQDIAAWKNSGPIKLSDLRGKVVLLEFWHYQCGPCVGTMPKLFSIYDKYHDKGLVVIGVHVHPKIETVAKLDEKLADIKKRLWKDRDIPFPVALARKHEVSYRPNVERKAGSLVRADYGITGVPTGVLIDRQGRVVGQFYHCSEDDEAALEKMLKEK